MAHLAARDLDQLFADVADTGSYGCFEYQGISVGLHTDDTDLLDWFRAFFGGYFTVTTSTQTDAVVYSCHDPEVYRRLAEEVTSLGRARPDGDREHPVGPQHRIVHTREGDGAVEENCFVLAQPGRRVLVSSAGTLQDRRKTVKRSLRNLMKLCLMERGWLPFHAAACTWNGTGICLIGGKFAGKTSTLVNLLTRPGAGFVTNDNLFLRDGGTCLQGCGFPNKAGLRIGALVTYPRLVDWIGQTTDSFYPQLDAGTFRQIVATTPPDELGSRSEKIVLLPTELAELLDVPIEHLTAIELFLVVRFDPALERSRLEPVRDPQQVRELLTANSRTLEKEKQHFLQSFFDLDDQTLRAAFDALLAAHVSLVAVYELHQNARTNEQSAELIEELTHQLQRSAPQR